VTSAAAIRAGSPDTGWRLRSGDGADVDAVLALWRAAEAEPSATDDPAGLAALLAHDPDALIVAEVDGRIVGSLIAGFDGWRANLYRLAVHPDLRRRGLARALVAEAERRLTEAGARRANALVVADHAPAVGFWQAAGYHRDPRIGRHVKGLDGEDDGLGC
jgi:ribosomal protein S18 acetylase RimI-like enzyme